MPARCWTKASVAPDDNGRSSTTKKKILAQLMGGKLFFLVALELPSTGCLGFGACARASAQTFHCVQCSESGVKMVHVGGTCRDVGSLLGYYINCRRLRARKRLETHLRHKVLHSLSRCPSAANNLPVRACARAQALHWSKKSVFGYLRLVSVGGGADASVPDWPRWAIV